jgi:hypothetical protein
MYTNHEDETNLDLSALDKLNISGYNSQNINSKILLNLQL